MMLSDATVIGRGCDGMDYDVTGLDMIPSYNKAIGLVQSCINDTASSDNTV